MTPAADPPLATSTGTATTRDGRSLHLERCGEGRPVVVFEAGMGVSHHSWGAVVPLVAEHTTTVAYDRSGLGRSPADPARRDLARLTDDLLDLLDHLGDGPFVLVGHSWGGPIVRNAAASAPYRVRGLVLVDPTEETCELYFTRGHDVQTRAFLAALPTVARLGMLRRMVSRFADMLPEPSASGLRREDGTVAATRTQVAELRPCGADLTALRNHPLDLPDVPVTYISGTMAGRVEGKRRTQLVEAHRRAASELPQGRHVEATGSSHFVPFSEPDVVAAEILRIVDLSGRES